MLAETVQLSDRDVAILLTIVVAFFASVAVIVIGGTFAAYRAGRGSSTALRLWIVALVLEAFAFVIGLVNTSQAALWAAIIGAAQLFAYQRGRERRAK